MKEKMYFLDLVPFLSVLFPASLLSIYLGTNRRLGSNKALSI